MIRSGLSLLLKDIPEIEALQVAGSTAELDPAPPAYSTWIVYLNDGSTLGRIGAYIHQPSGLLLIRGDDLETGQNPGDLASSWGVVSTAISPEAFRAAILAVTEGLNVIELNLAPRYETIFTPVFESGEVHESLTERELSVLRKIAEGLTNKKIAMELGISENTVKFHISALFSKLNASSRTDAVRRGARLGLLAL